MTKLSLRARMILLTLAPTLALGLLMSSWFVIHRYSELQRQLLFAGTNIIEPLAVSCEYGMTYYDKDAIRNLVSLLHRRHSSIVRAISVFDNQKQLYVSSNNNQNTGLMMSGHTTPFTDDVAMIRQGNLTILRTPIISRGNDAQRTSQGSRSHRKNILGYVAIELDLRAIRLELYQEIFISALLLITSLGAALLIAWRLSHDITLPIRKMALTVDRIGRGHSGSRVTGVIPGELSLLQKGINGMAASLEEYHQEMQESINQATSDLRETLEQLEIRNIELDLANKRAQQVVRLKSGFLSTMSHELRTPLNGVIGFSRQLLKTPLDETQRDYLKTIERSAGHLLTIINDVLDFSKLEAGQLTLESIPFPLRATLDETLELLAPAAHDKGLELTVSIDPKLPDNLKGDPLRFRQILMNLIDNAIKFTPQGTVRVAIETLDQQPDEVTLQLQVSDTGIGISQQQQSRIFDAFIQADASISRRHGGTGLGLEITRQLVHKMAGTIDVSHHDPQGTIFTVLLTFPLSPQIPAVAAGYPAVNGQQLFYIESHPQAACDGKASLSGLPWQVQHFQTPQHLPPQQADWLIYAVPPDLTVQQLLSARLPETLHQHGRKIIMLLPAPLMNDAETLRQQGLRVIVKPLTLPKILQALRYQPLSTKQQVPLAAMPRLPLTVLAVDDNAANLKLIGALLKDQVTDCILCQSAKQAIDIASQRPLDAILMDVQMPEIDGLQASTQIRELPLHQHTPIIAVTAFPLEKQQQQFLAAGMNESLAKPVNEKILYRLLSRYAPQQTKDTPHSQDSVIDWPLALQRAAGKTCLAKEMLEMLLNSLPEVQQVLTGPLLPGLHQDILHQVHKLQGSCAYCGVPQLQQCCQRLEEALRKQPDPRELEPEIFELLDETDRVLIAGKEWLAKA